jgi:glycine/D-amino acid oxidase-like deaminating enzyme
MYKSGLKQRRGEKLHITRELKSLAFVRPAVTDEAYELDNDDTTQRDLRSPNTPWAHSNPQQSRPIERSFRCEVLIIGAGITGALVAQRLVRDGRDVVLVDREDPSQGSTMASTAMLLWEIDRSLTELTEIYGLERATRCYRASLFAVNRLVDLVNSNLIDCDLRQRQSLYISADDSSKRVFDEFSLRERSGFPGQYLDHASLLNNFGIARSAAILSPLAADADPVRLTNGLLGVARAGGVRLLRGNAVHFESEGRIAHVTFENDAEVEAQHVVLATGYAMPDIVRCEIQTPASSWAIATVPQPQRLWPDGVMIWEATQDYHYARTTADGRIIFGGEDDRVLIEASAREAATPDRSERLKAALTSLWPTAETRLDYRWSGTFDTTDDGLPLIGRVPGFGNIYAAYGYGGNGITFSFLAAELIARRLSGGTSSLFDTFAIDRPSIALTGE